MKTILTLLALLAVTALAAPAPVGISGGLDVFATKPSPELQSARDRLAALETRQDALVAKRGELIDSRPVRPNTAITKRIDAALQKLDEEIAANGRQLHIQHQYVKRLTGQLAPQKKEVKK